VQLFLEQQPAAAIALKEVDDPRRFGVARLEGKEEGTVPPGDSPLAQRYTSRTSHTADQFL